MAKEKHQFKEEKEVISVRNNEDDDNSPWIDIPEFAFPISNLSLSDRIRFRLSCKGWKNVKLPPRLIPDLHMIHNFSTSNPSKGSSQDYSPWLMFYHSRDSEEGECKFFHPFSNGTRLSYFPELLGSTICHAKHGWLLLCFGPRGYLLFFHPLKRTIIHLPIAPFGTEVSIFSFSSPPTAPDCVVFCTTQFVWSPEDVWFYHLHRGQASWQIGRYSCKINEPDFVPSLCNPVFYHGEFCCLSEDGRLGVFNPKKTTWKIIQKLRGPNISSTYMNFLAEYDGDLISVFFGKNMGDSVHVFRLDRKLMKWVKLEDLGDRMMFVSHATSLLLPAVIKGAENKIYLPYFQEEGLVHYSLCTRKYSIFDTDYSLENLHTTFRYMNCTWIDFDTSTNSGTEEDFNTNSYTEEELAWLSNPLGGDDN